MRGQGQGQTTRSFWPKNNPYYEVLVLENSWNNQYEHLYILKDLTLYFKKKKKNQTGNSVVGLNFDPKFLKLVL